MAKFPEPPSPQELETPGPADIHHLPARTRVWRIYFRGGRQPTSWDEFRHFGPTSARFDHHLEPARVQERGVLYAAPLGPTCLAEVYQDARTVDLRAGDPWLVEFELTRIVPLLDLTSLWVTRAGASGAMDSGPRPRARRWSRVIYEACPDIEGLLYRSSMDPQGVALALYERAKSAVPSRPETHRALADPVLFDAIAQAAFQLGYSLV
ncbi:MAG: RES family NAD+ phosphorylase [Myxococcota bacterium]